MITYQQTLEEVDKSFQRIRRNWTWLLRGKQITPGDFEAFSKDLAEHTARAEWTAIEMAATVQKLVAENETLKATIIAYGCDQHYTPEQIAEMQQQNMMAIPAWLTDYIDYDRLQNDVTSKRIRYVRC